jgi:hypothetical protein
LDLSKRLGDRNLFAILGGAWVFHTVRGNLEEARRYSLDFMTAAERDSSPEMMLVRSFLLGSCLFHLGRLETSLAHMTAASAMDSGPRNPFWPSLPGRISVFFADRICLTWRGIARTAIALDYATLLDVFRGESRAALERGRQAVELHRVGEGDTAVGHRDAVWSEVIVEVDPDPANRERSSRGRGSITMPCIRLAPAALI